MTWKELATSLRQKLEHIHGAGEAGAMVRHYFRERFNVDLAHVIHAAGKVPADWRSDEFERDSSMLIHGKPVQYVLGYEWFNGKKFLVDESVLIPRPETEELTKMVISDIGARSVSILDIGTGSGCIAVTLALELQQACVTGIDISEAALKVARKNADLHQAGVNLLHRDLFDDYILEEGPFDVVISNPPYIPGRQADEMHHSVLSFEPHIALFVEDIDPLKFYRRIIELRGRLYLPGATVYFEISPGYAGDIEKLLLDHSFDEISIFSDLSGHHRFVKGTFLANN
jgi:release factor glutamine methyltransferase